MTLAGALEGWLALRKQGRFEDAHRRYAQIRLQLAPADFEVVYALAVTALRVQETQAAHELLRLAVSLDASNAPAHCHLGIALYMLGQHPESVSSYDRALAITPDYPVALNNRGSALQEMGRYEDAVTSFEQALGYDPRYAEAFFNRGNALQSLQRHVDAIASYERALELNPSYVKAFINRGNALFALGRHAEAIASHDRALELCANSADAFHNRGNALLELGNLHAAIESYRSARALRSGEPQTHHALMHCLLRISTNADELNALYQAFDTQFGSPAPVPVHHNSRDPGRRLRIGYVSADFREHPVAFHIEPILASHDTREVEVYCYSSNSVEDAVTGRLQRSCSHWRPIAHLSNEELASLVQQDGIDILFDLSGHTAGNRLLAFARKPAPIQVTWLGLPATTGLSRIDYRLTDAHIDPPDMTERFQSERLVRLSTHACYRPPFLPDIGELPALRNSYLTYASFNEADKLSPATCALWSKLLLAVPGSRLVIVCKQPVVRLLQHRFTTLGVDVDRLRFMNRLSLADYLELHNTVDVALDPFPFNGGTVTRNALWMGVPVVTLQGTLPHSRVGSALLSAMGLQSFVATTEEEYIGIAARCASNPEYLAELRRTLRRRMAEARFSDPTVYTRELEAVLREMWRAWCVSAPINGKAAP